jgi:hypothetical protein
MHKKNPMYFLELKPYKDFKQTFRRKEAATLVFLLSILVFEAIAMFDFPKP